MDKTPLVSIIIPNFNHSRFLRERLESVFNQTFEDFEVILLDDASTDSSVEILEEYAKDPRVSHLVVNKENSGSPFRQWQRGIELSRGEYIWIAESDDSCDPDFLLTCVAMMKNNPKAVIAFGGSITIDENSSKIEIDNDRWYDKRFKKRQGECRVFDGIRYITHNLIWINYIYNASGTLFRRDAYGDGSEFESCMKMRNAGDWLFWSIMATKGDVIEIYRKLNHFRFHSGSTTREGVNKGKSNWNLFDEDFIVLRHIFENTRIPTLRKMIRLGALMKKIQRAQMSEEDRKAAYLKGKELLKYNKKDYLTERISKTLSNFIPGISTIRNDRL